MGWGGLLVLLLVVGTARGQGSAASTLPPTPAPTRPNCAGITDAVTCNATYGCYYPNSTNTTGPCREKQPITPGNPVAAPESPWCYQYFPLEVTVFLYFLNCFTVGFGLIGLWYNQRYYNVRNRIDKFKQKYFNKLRGQQWIFIIWCTLFVVIGALLVVFAMAYFMEPTFCLWVTMAYAYFGLVILCFLFFLIRAILIEVRNSYRKKREERREAKRIATMFDSLRQKGRDTFGRETCVRYF